MVVFLSLSCFLAAEDIPSDVTPFVKLGRLVKVSFYKNPVIDKRSKEIKHNGQLIKENLVQVPAGSGTIISPGGLILTNYHVYQMKNYFKYDSKKNMLLRETPAGKTMLVYRLAGNDPLKVPALHYSAAPVSLDKKHDTAILKIISDEKGKLISKNDFSYVSIGNPFAMRINEDITIIGYPSKGGDTVTITGGKFLGYYRSKRFYGLDGFIKTDGAMAPGNSGGAAMNKGTLIGVPTSVTLPTAAGSDLGYIHPVTWAAKTLTIANRKYGYKTPEIPVQWFYTDYNTDETKTFLYVTGNIISSHSNRPVSAEVAITRPDRTFTQIKNLHRQIQSVIKIYAARDLHKRGMSVEKIAKQFKMPRGKIEKFLTAKRTGENLSPDTTRYMKGEFFYKNANSDRKGFFILSIPRGRNVKVYVIKKGFRPVIRDAAIGSGVSHSLGAIKIFKQ